MIIVIPFGSTVGVVKRTLERIHLGIKYQIIRVERCIDVYCHNS